MDELGAIDSIADYIFEKSLGTGRYTQVRFAFWAVVCNTRSPEIKLPNETNLQEMEED